MVPPCHSLGVANSRVISVCSPNIAIFSPVWPETGPNRSKSNLNLKSTVQTVRTGIPTGLTGLPAGLIGNPPNSNFFLFWFKFKCPQSILNECLYNMF